MTSSVINRRLAQCIGALAMLLIAAMPSGCSISSPEVDVSTDQKTSLDLGFIAFGDSGYHADFIEEDEYEPPRGTLEEFNAIARLDWIDDRRAPEDFTPPVPYFMKEHGSYVEASGMHPVATAMQRHCETVACEFSVMLGDNIYPDGATLGADGVEDSVRFKTLFEAPFGTMGGDNDDYRIYVALGNHDWHTSREGAMAEVTYMENTRPFYMDGNIYRVKPPAGRGEVELFIIDTSVLLKTTVVMEDELNVDGSEKVSEEVEEFDPWLEPSTELERNMVGWLEQSLRESTARWKFVIAHHPVWSSGGSKFEQARSLRPLLLPTMCRYADAYFVGHEHALELHEDNCKAYMDDAIARPLTEIISGAAAKQRGVNSGFVRYQSQHYPQNKTVWAKGMIWGFAHVQLQDDIATVSMFTTPNDGSGEVVPAYQHQFQRRSGSLGK